MPVTTAPMTGFGGVQVDVAIREIDGRDYQMMDPEVLTFHRVSLGSGDAVNIAAFPVVLRAVHITSDDSDLCMVKFHNTAGTPSAGFGVVYTRGCQAGTVNPDPRLSGGGRAFSTGLGMTIVRGTTDASPTGVTAGSVVVEVEYHKA